MWTSILFSFFFFKSYISQLPENSRVRHSHYHMFTLHIRLSKPWFWLPWRRCFSKDNHSFYLLEILNPSCKNDQNFRKKIWWTW